MIGHVFKIAVIPGDGIGPEVIREGLKILSAVKKEVILKPKVFPFGAAHYKKTGEVLSDRSLRELEKYDAIYLGAVGRPDVPPGILERDLLLRLRFSLDLGINLRPVILYPGLESPIKGKGPKEIDFIVIRENTEGPYSGAGGVLRKGTIDEVAVQEDLNTRRGVERAIRYAFKLASKRPKKKVTLVDKANVLTFAHDLWRRAFAAVARDYPNVSTEAIYVDACAMYFVTQPERFDVVVTNNMFGDILTDLGAVVAGGIGIAASANINPERRFPSLFEPVHGSAPDIAGKGKANPIAAILAGVLMLDFLGARGPARRIENAVRKVFVRGEGTGRSTRSISQSILSCL